MPSVSKRAGVVAAFLSALCVCSTSAPAATAPLYTRLGGEPVMTAVVSAMFPAMKAAKVDPAEALKSDSSRGMTRHDAGLVRDGLVVAEVARRSC